MEPRYLKRTSDIYVMIALVNGDGAITGQPRIMERRLIPAKNLADGEALFNKIAREVGAFSLADSALYWEES